MPRITADAFLQLLHDTLPETRDLDLAIESLTRGEVRVRLGFDERKLRPGGTLSGPTVMMLADLALYAVTLSIVGFEPLAVTTDRSIHFLRKPLPGPLWCHGRVIKGGKRLVVATADLYSESACTEPVAHVVGTYSVPPGARA